MEIFLKILFVLLAYLLGSIPFGFIIGKIKGVDIREVGSKNIGATNVGRILGRGWSIATYLLDMTKGFILTFLFAYSIIPSEYMVLNPMLYGFLATFGHSFSIFMKFKGGKSVSVASGAVAGYFPIMLPVMLIVFMIVLKIGKLVSIASLVTVLFTILLGLLISLLTKEFAKMEASVMLDGAIVRQPFNYLFLIFLTLEGAVIYLKHIPNIKRIFKHEEKPVNY